MAFTAECPFCHGQFRNVPHERVGASVECPRCYSFFTLAPLATSGQIEKPADGEQATPRTRGKLRGGRSANGHRSLAQLEADLGRADESAAEGRDHPLWLGITAFFLGSVALLCASFPSFDVVTLPASGLGVALASIGLLHPAKTRRRVWPATGLLVSLSVCVIAGFWPTLLGMAPHSGAANLPVHEQLVAVPRDNRDGSAAWPATEFDWIDATQDALHKSDLRLVITAATVQAIPYKNSDGKKAVTQDKYLRIALRLSNVGINHSITYRSWSEPVDSTAAPTLQDNLGKTYAVKSFGTGVTVTGHVTQATIAPLNAVLDALVFEAPGAGFDYLHLELPCAAFGAAETFRIVIPKSRVVYQ
jgi:hypothetical protein